MRSLALVVVIAASLVACKKPEAPKAAQAPGDAAQAAAPSKSALQGKILEKLEAQPYSYLKLKTASGDVWAAVPATQRAVGADAVVEGAFPMKDFESKSLNRKFDVVYFGTLQGEGGSPMGGAAAETHGPGDGHDHGAPAAQGMPAGMGGGMGGAMGQPPPQMGAQHAQVASGPTDVKVQKVSKASGADARTVEEIWTQKGALKEKSVTVRGQVVKFSPGIMGRNWVHLRDGSGSAEKATHDITVTTQDEVKVGDVVTAKGTVRADKDFGAGYAYPVIVEEAKVSK